MCKVVILFARCFFAIVTLAAGACDATSDELSNVSCGILRLRVRPTAEAESAVALLRPQHEALAHAVMVATGMRSVELGGMDYGVLAGPSPPAEHIQIHFTGEGATVHVDAAELLGHVKLAVTPTLDPLGAALAESVEAAIVEWVSDSEATSPMDAIDEPGGASGGSGDMRSDQAESELFLFRASLQAASTGSEHLFAIFREHADNFIRILAIYLEIGRPELKEISVPSFERDAAEGETTLTFEGLAPPSICTTIRSAPDAMLMRMRQVLGALAQQGDPIGIEITEGSVTVHYAMQADLFPMLEETGVASLGSESQDIIPADGSVSLVGTDDEEAGASRSTCAQAGCLAFVGLVSSLAIAEPFPASM